MKNTKKYTESDLNEWYCPFKEITQAVVNNNEGFVYMITNLQNNKFYIGKKNFKITSKVKIGKKEKSETKTRKTYKEVVKESNWKTYTGSCVELNDDIKKYGLKNFKKEILRICKTKKYLTFSELEFQFLYKVLYSNKSYNGNIMSKFFKRDIQDGIIN